jgi:hypothetical protein
MIEKGKTFMLFFGTPFMDVRKPFSDVSLWILLFSNLITIGIALKEDWSLATIVIAYWVQSCIIGFFNVVRILSLKDFSLGSVRFDTQFTFITEKIKYVIAGFFAFHYGFFHLAYGVFLFAFAFIYAYEADVLHIMVVSVIFFFDHLFSFRYNKKRDEKKKRSILRLMFFPYARIIPMHIVILFFGFSFGERPLLIFLGLKTLADVAMHVIEHEW